MAYKVFTNGSTLQASEVNDNLMKQAVATFSNAAARTAAITVPVEGQMTYLEDVDRYDHWNGSAWISPFGYTLLTRATFSAASAVNVNTVFSSSYDNYEVFLQLDASSTSQGVNLRVRQNSTDESGLTYYYTGVSTIQTSGTVSVNNGNGVTFVQVARATDQTSARITLFNPFRANRTHIDYASSGQFGDILFNRGTGVVFNNSSYNGFSILAGTGTITGNLRVYGIRN